MSDVVATPALAVYRTRPIVEADHAFVLKTWLHDFSHSRFASDIDKPLFFAEHHTRATRLLEGGGIVAVLADMDSSILGFAVGAEKVLHYVFTRGQWRQIGVGTAMLRGLFGDCAIEFTHRTDEGAKFLRGRIPGARYNPYKAEKR